MTVYIDPVFALFAQVSVDTLNLFGAGLAQPVLEPDAFPFWDSVMTVLSVVAQILMTRKYVENWILWYLSMWSASASMPPRGLCPVD